ncbi:hypothetical protein [Roseovarius rhodophyticola]|uniref:DUF1440 domain-containing protein n=1 Tax=Roseovarius rhodophyticola TaxID=3080827 RepID=A0ABZ2TH23_9RHOB|nr:hypothetical protein [Roseovarius sp. W115]MDV2930772.1 hypothetical protein [Roseovarius sp. W115]
MTDIATPTSRGWALPSISVNTLMLILLGGAAGTLAFDLFGRAISPLLGFASLAPVGLARGFLGALDLPNSAAYGHLMHLFFVGLLAYPIGWLFVARPVLARVMPSLHWLPASVAYGIGLWVFAIGGIATFAGNAPFLNFTGITWVALAGHVLYAIVTAATIAYLERLQNAR